MSRLQHSVDTPKKTPSIAFEPPQYYQPQHPLFQQAEANWFEANDIYYIYHNTHKKYQMFLTNRYDETKAFSDFIAHVKKMKNLKNWDEKSPGKNINNEIIQSTISYILHVKKQEIDRMNTSPYFKDDKMAFLHYVEFLGHICCFLDKIYPKDNALNSSSGTKNHIKIKAFKINASKLRK